MTGGIIAVAAIVVIVVVALAIIAANLPSGKARGGGKMTGQAKDPVPVNVEEWLLHSVQFFRQLGFYAQYKDLSNQDLAEKLQALYHEEWQRPIEPSGELADLNLLVFDEARVWWNDTEADVMAGNDVYVRTLQEWARIARGAFSPTAIVETWDDEEGPISITFQLNGTRHRINPQYLEDYIDTFIVDDINRLIEPTGYAFEAYETFDQTAFIVVLTAEEKQQLERERGWRFMR